MATTTKQTTKAVLKSTASFALDTLDAAKFYDASLTGNSLSGAAHAVLKSINSTLAGDSLTAVGDYATLTGGAGKDSLKALGYNDVLVAGAGANTLVASSKGTTFQLASTAQLQNDLIKGAAGIDTLVLTKAAGTLLGDAVFANVSGTEVLSLTGANSVTLGATARGAGINRVIGGAAASSYLEDASFSGSLTIAGGAGKDIISVANRTQLAADSLVGGGGADTLVVRGAAAIADSDFSKVSAIGTLSLGSASSVTLGSAASLAGVANVVAGDGAVRLVQNDGNNSALTLRGGAGDDTFVVGTGAQLASDVVSGGSGANALLIASAGSIDDASFAKVTGVQALSLTSVSDVTLGSNAAKAGILTVYGGVASDSITQDAKSTAKIAVVGGGADDFIGLGSVKQLAADTVIGSSGTDTLAVLSAGAIVDASFANIAGVEALSLTGASTVTLDGSAGAAGFTTIYGGDGLTKITHTSGDSRSLTIVGGYGTDLVTVADGQVLANDSIVAGSGGAGTLAVASDATLDDGSFAKVQNIGALSLTGASAVTLGSAAVAAQITTVIGGAGDSTFSQTASAAVQITAGRGNDLIALSDVAYLADDTLTGGTGVNTLALSGSAEISDDAFTNHKGLQVLALDGDSSVTLEAAAQKAGVVSVIGGAGDLTVTQTSANSASLTLVGGSGDGNFSVATAAQLGKDSIVGGAGSNTLSISSDATLADKSFAKVAGVQALSLTGSSTVILGAASSAAEFATIFGGDGTTAITQTADNTNSLTIVGGDGTDLITLAKGDYLAADSIVGGSGDIATIVVAAGATLEDDAFAQIQNVGVLKLTGASDLALDAQAAAAGISTVYGGSGNSNYSLLSGATTLVANRGNDLVSIQEAGQLADDSIVGGGGKDTLQLLADAELSDDSFANVQGVTVLSLNGASAVTLDSAAMAAGIAVVAAGDGNSSLTQGAGDTAALQLLGGAGDDLISVDSVDLLAKDIVTGNDGTDTLVIANEGAVVNTTLSKVRGVEVLQLSGSSSAVLAANALKDNLQTIVGGEGDTTITQAVAANLPLYIDGSASSSNLVGVANQALLTNDTVVGGDGTDTLSITSAGQVADDAFANVAGFEVLSLAGASAVTLGDNATATAGILTVLGGAGNSTFRQTAGALNIVAQGGNDLFVVDSSDIIAADTLAGGDGVNTLRVSTESEIADDAFTNVTGIQALALNGASTVTLGGAASAAGITLVAAGSGDTTLTQTADDANATKILGNDGNDLIVLENTDLLAADTVAGGKGINTLSIGGDAELSDDAFKNLKQIGFLSLSGADAVTLGSAARNAGISSIQGGDSDGSYVQTAGVISLAAGAGNDLVSVLSSKMLATDTISGGDGDNTLVIAAATKLSDENFTNTTGFGVLSLTGSSAVVLGAAAGTAGITSVFGGEGASTFLHTADDATSLYLDGTQGAGNLFAVSSADQAAGDTFAGAGADTLQINGDSTVDEGTLANIQGITALKLNGASSANLDAVGAAGILTLFGGAGAGTYTEEAGADGLLLKAGAAGDIITVSDAGFLAGQTLDGGLGNDTLVISQDGIEVADETFANLVSINSVSIAGAAQVTLDSAALAAGVTAVSLGDGDSSFTQLENDTLALSLTSGAGNDLFSINDGKQLTKDFLISGDGSDTLQIVTESNKISDRNFARISGFEVLSLAANNSVELAALATDGLVADAGATIIAGLGGTTLNAANYGNALVVDASTDEAGNNSIALGGTASTILMGNGDAFASSTIRGGSDVDTLALTGADGYTLEDDAFANKNGIDVLQIQNPFSEDPSNSGDNVITFGINAWKSGITTLVGGTGNTTLSQVQGNRTALYFNGSAAATNLVSVDVPSIANNDTFVGGEGEDTLAIGYANDDGNPVNEVRDDAFANKTSFETLVLTGASAVTLGDNAAGDIGLKNVVLGDGDSEVLQTAGSFTITGTAAASVSVTVDSVELLAADTILGGDGADTISLNNEGEISDDVFAYITGVEVLAAAGSSNITIGDNAGANGLTTVILGDGDSTLSQTAGAIATDASNSSSAFVTVDNVDLLAADTILGGDGVDTLVIANDGDITDDALANVSAVDVLVATGSSNVTLDANAGANGLNTVILGDGDSTVVQTAGSFLIDASASSSAKFTVGTSALLSGDTITAGDGSDTLAISEEGAITDDQFAVVTAVEVLQVAGASSVQLGDNAAANGLNTVILGDGDAVVYQTAGAFLIDATTTSSASVVIDTIDLLLADTVTGGDGVDTVTLSSEGEITDDAFTNITGVEVLQASGSSSIALGDNAAGNGLATVVLGDGASTLTQTAGAFAIDGSNGASAFLSIDTTDLAAADTITGTSGTDTLLLVNEGDVSDELFANKTGLEILQLTGASNVTLGDNASSEDLALQSILLGDGDGTVTQSAGAFLIDASAAASAKISVDSAELAAGDTITGGDGTDTLAIAGEGDISDAVFANVTGVEIFQASGSSNIELSNNAGSNGVTTVILGDGDSTVTQSDGAFLVDGSGSGSAKITLASIELAAGDTITGGDGVDTLSISAQGEITDEAFTNVTAVEVLQATGSSAITLGDAAGANGLATVILGDGDSTLTQSAGAFLVDGSASASILAKVAGAEIAAADTLTGGAGTDTLSVASEGDVADKTFANVTDFEVLQTTGASAVTLGDNAASNGLNTVILGDGDSTVVQTAGAFTVDASASSTVLLTVDSAELAAADAITGGAGIDTLALVNEGDVADETFTNITAVDVLVTSGASNVTLGDNASGNGLATVILGDGDSTVVQTAGAFEINASAASSVKVTVDNADLATADTITGGDGTDTLAIANDASLSDEVFANKASLEILSLTGTSAVTLGDNAAGDVGLTTVILGDGDSTVVQTAGVFAIDGSAASSVKVTVDNADLALADTISGGDGIDTLSLASEGDITDEIFANKASVEVLYVAGSSNVTLGDNAAGDIGLTTVILGDGDSTVTQTAGAFLIDASASASVKVTADSAELATADTIIGGDGVDTLAIANEGEISDDVFANKTGVEILQATGASAVTLGDNAANADLGLATVILGDGDSTLTQTAGSFAINASASSTALISVDSADILAADTITGGDGADTLAIVNEGEIADESFSNVSAVEFLQLSGSSTVTLGDNAGANGLTTVVLGDGDSTLTQSAGAFAIDASGSATALISIDTAVIAAANTITGGDGVDTLSIVNGGDVADETFANITAVDVLVTGGASNVTLGDSASGNGLATVILGDGDSTVFQTGGAFEINASAASSAKVTVDTTDLAIADTILGGDGVDTLVIANEGDLADATFANITAVDVLVTAGASNVTLGDNAAAKGLTTVIVGDGDSTVKQTAGTFQIDGSASSSISVTIDTAELATPDTILGGAGTDTLTVLHGDIADDVFADKSGFEVIAVGAGASITLGGNAGSEGVSSVYGSSGDSTITQSAENTSALYLDASASASVAFVVDSAAIASNDTFVGGAGTDTLKLATEASAGDELLANASSIEVLVLSGASNIALGDSAAQLTKVIGGDGDTTLSQTAGAINLDLSASSTSSITIGAGSIFAADSITGGSGTDTVTVGSSATLGDGAFANKSSIELLQLTENASVTLDGNAYASGTRTVAGGTGDVRIALGASETRSLFIDGGAAASTYFSVASGAQAAGLESLVGASNGSSTLSVGEGAVADSAFAHASNVAVLQLNGSSNLTLNTAANAITSMLTVVGGSGSSTISQGADEINALLLDGRAGSSNLFVIAQAGQVSNDTIYGGSGTSTLGISTADNLLDENLANVRGIDVLTLAGGSTADLGANLDLAGISSIVAGSGDSSTISAAGSSSNLVIDGSRGSSANVLTAGAGNDTLIAGSSADTMTGGDGADLFVLGSGTGAGAAVIADFTVGTDALQLTDFGAGASDYSLIGAGSGVDQLFHGDTLVANLNFSGDEASILSNARFI